MGKMLSVWDEAGRKSQLRGRRAAKARGDSGGWNGGKGGGIRGVPGHGGGERVGDPNGTHHGGHSPAGCRNAGGGRRVRGIGNCRGKAEISPFSTPGKMELWAGGTVGDGSFWGPGAHPATTIRSRFGGGRKGKAPDVGLHGRERKIGIEYRAGPHFRKKAARFREKKTNLTSQARGKHRGRRGYKRLRCPR